MKGYEYRSSGKEPYVFKVDNPRNLFGAHADLIGTTLYPEESLLYPLYSPIWESEKGVFDFKTDPEFLWEGERAILAAHTYPASHAVAVTDQRFIISEDRHIKGITPTVQAIPFQEVICVELGSALILGWLSIRFVENNRLSSTGLLFTTSTGRDHFHAAVREYRRVIGSPGEELQRGTIPWEEVWHQTALLQRERLKLLILKREQPVCVIHSSETWGMEKRGWKKRPLCLNAKGIFVATNFGLIYAVDEPPLKPGMVSFGINVCCIPPDVLKTATLLEKKAHEHNLRFLRFEIGRDSASLHCDIPFDDRNCQDASDLTHWLEKRNG